MTAKTQQQAERVAEIKRQHGDDCYRRWGRRGGNPLLIALKKVNEARRAASS
ncbi:hypothetical protein DEALK_0977 [Dehalogenimonas alkenigignens]|uniref:Uncharacterized protein n=1 Tax=Dehalogenimonas alkenigignens TaxID=1217799 RepID=A0A0W0GHV1_9CHLR|nr:hypothetical protein [Dehalogenimonas alkenigignens]KTB48132.1 hypothetical protein DEALK_0977 [Dehalogenimonas alkenigignens]